MSGVAQQKIKGAITAGQLCERIAAVHCPPEWACFFEVGDATGYRTKRHADAVAMSIWPSRGLVIRGFEVKISRADYRREAADPMKAESIARFCDEWWLVTPPGLISDPETEMPPAWGLMTANGDGLKTARPATRTEAEPISRTFLAAVLRRAHATVSETRSRWIRREDIQGEIDKAYENGKKDAPQELQHFKNLAEHLEKRIQTFKEYTGLDLMEGGCGGYTGNVGDISVFYRTGRALLKSTYGGDFGRLFKAIENVENTTHSIRDSLREIKAIWEAGKLPSKEGQP